MKSTTRRDFIKISSLSTVGFLSGAAISGLSNSASAQNATLKGKINRVPTYCEVCFWKCAGWVYLDDDNEVWKIEGNKNDPFCTGRLCPRGTGGVGMYFDEDRLKTPLIRTEERGEQVFKEASWEEAFAYIAKKLKKVKSEHGAESLALFNHGSGGKHFSSLVKAFGSNNITAPSFAQCRGPREVGFETTFGKAINSPEPTDIKNTKCLVLIGSHIGENMHNSQIQEMSDAIDNGATIITVDPRLSTAASHSTHWLPIKPATDIALLLAWMNVIINEELYDKKYVEKYCYGLDDLIEHVADKTPEWAEKITTIEASVIRETARQMAFKAPATIVHPGRHVTWYGDDTQRLRCVAILNALLGSWGRKGGFFFPKSAGLPSYPHPPYPTPSWDWKDTLNKRYPLAGQSVANAIVDASHPDNETAKKIKAWMVVGTNLVFTMPDQKRTYEAIQNLDLIVAVDTMPMEITGWADVILPECTYLERMDHPRVSSGRTPSIAVRFPAAKPKHLTKPASWMVKRLSIKLGLSEYFTYGDFSETVDWQLKQIGSSLEEAKKVGVIRYEIPEKDLYMDENETMEFNTPTGMIELYSLAMDEAGFDPLPPFTAHPQPKEGYYRLNYGRAPMHTFSRTSNNPNLSDLLPENYLWMNPKVAKEWGIKAEQEIWLKNQDGKISSWPIKVRLTERNGYNSVYMVHGFGHNNKKLSRAHGKGISDTEMITNVMIDPVMGGTGMRGNFVTFLVEDPGKEVVS